MSDTTKFDGIEMERRQLRRRNTERRFISERRRDSRSGQEVCERRVHRDRRKFSERRVYVWPTPDRIH